MVKIMSQNEITHTIQNNIVHDLINHSNQGWKTEHDRFKNNKV